MMSFPATSPKISNLNTEPWLECRLRNAVLSMAPKETTGSEYEPFTLVS
jgi:hypothetical protein